VNPNALTGLPRKQMTRQPVLLRLGVFDINPEAVSRLQGKKGKLAFLGDDIGLIPQDSSRHGRIGQDQNAATKANAGGGAQVAEQPL
jgi:hypothetical protein